MAKQNKVVSVLSTSAISGLVASALMTSQAFAAVDAYTVKVGGDVYQYSKTELMESYLDSTEGTKAPLFEDFQAKMTEGKGVFAYHDDKSGYVTAQSVFDKYLENEAKFNLDEFTASKDAKVTEVPTVKKAVVKDGEVKFEDQNNGQTEEGKVKVESVSAINLKQVKIEFASKVTDSDLKKDVEDVDNYSLEDKDGDEVETDMIKEVKLDDSKKFAILTFKDKVDNKGKYVIENREKYTLVIDDDVTGDEYRKDLVFEDRDLPEVEKVEAVGVDTIKVVFSEPIRPYNIADMSNKNDVMPELDDDDFEINDGDLSINKVELVNNNKEANIIVGTNFKNGDKLKVKVKSSVVDYAGLATMSPIKETTVSEDKKAPEIVGFKDIDTEDIDSVTYEKVTLMFDKDIKFKNMDDTVLTKDEDLKNYYHTADKKSNLAKKIKVDGKELTLYFEDDSFTNGSTNIYIKSGSLESRWEVENEKLSTRIEKEIDRTAPEITKVEQHEDYNNRIKVKFSEKVKTGDGSEDKSALKSKNYTLKDEKGKEWKIDKVEKDGTSEKEFIIITSKDLDDDVKYKLTIENVEDKAGNAIKKVTKEFKAADNDAVKEDDIKVKVYSAGTSSQKLVVDFDTKMKTDKSRYSAKDLSKYTLIAKNAKGDLLDVFDGKSSINISDMYKADIKSAKNDKAVEINLPSKNNNGELKDKQFNLSDLSVKDKNDKVIIPHKDIELFIQVDRVEDANGNITVRNFERPINDFLGKGSKGSITFDTDDDFKPQIVSPEEIFFGLDDKVDFNLKDIKVIAAKNIGDAKDAADVLAGTMEYEKDADKADVNKKALAKVKELSIATHKKDVNSDGNTTIKLTMDKDLRNKRYDDDDFNHIFNYNGKYQATELNEKTKEIVPVGDELNVYVFAIPTKTVGKEDVTSTKNDYDETLKLGAKGLAEVSDELAPAIADNDKMADGYKYATSNNDNNDEVVQYWYNKNDNTGCIVLTFEEAIDPASVSRSSVTLNKDDFKDASVSDVKAVDNKVYITIKELTDGKDNNDEWKKVAIEKGDEIVVKGIRDLADNEAKELKLQVGDFKALSEMPKDIADENSVVNVENAISAIPSKLTDKDMEKVEKANTEYEALGDLNGEIKTSSVTKLKDAVALKEEHGKVANLKLPEVTQDTVTKAIANAINNPSVGVSVKAGDAGKYTVTLSKGKLTAEKGIIVEQEKDTDSTLKTFKIGTVNTLALENVTTTGAEQTYTKFDDDAVKGISVEKNSAKAKSVVVKVNDIEVVAGQLATKVLAENDVITVVVTAENDSTTTYKITVKKAEEKDTDSALKTFKIGTVNTLALENVTTTGAEQTYTKFDDDAVKGISVEKNSAKAKSVVVKVNDIEVVAGQLATKVLAENDVITVVVTAENDSTTTYKVTVKKA